MNKILFELFECFERISTRTMTSIKNEATRIIGKFNGGKFHDWKFKIKMLMASMDLWDIVDKSKEPLPSNADPKILNEYRKRVKKVTSIIGLNVVDNQLTHIKNCKGPADAWKTFCNIHKTKGLSNILFIHHKFLTCKMQKEDDLLDDVNKIKVLMDQFVCLEVFVKDENMVMTSVGLLLRVDPGIRKDTGRVCAKPSRLVSQVSKP